MAASAAASCIFFSFVTWRVISRFYTLFLGAVWFLKCNVNGNGNGLHSITSGNKFE
jgi:hypothetical protein